MPARLTVAGVAFLREWISKIMRIAAVSGIRSFDTRVNTCPFAHDFGETPVIPQHKGSARQAVAGCRMGVGVGVGGGGESIPTVL